MSRPPLAAALAVTLAATCTAGCREDALPAQPEAPLPARSEKGYAVRWAAPESDLPWNRTLYLSVTEGGRPWELFTTLFPEGLTETTVPGRPGLPWRLRSEVEPNDAMRRLFWMVDESGVFSDGTAIAVSPPPRSRIVVGGDDSIAPGPDTLTVAEDGGGARLVARRDHLTGVRISFWDSALPPAREDWRSAKLGAPTRPWDFPEIREGRFVIAAQCRGRTWTARRVDLRAGETVHIDVVSQPAGGGTVLCEDGRAELLLGSDLPVPSLRIADPTYRAVWEGVPAGKHSVRWPDGTEREIDVKDGAEVRLPRRP